MSEENARHHTEEFDMYTYDLLRVDTSILVYYNDALSSSSLNPRERKLLESKLAVLNKQETDNCGLVLRYDDILCLHRCLNKTQEHGEKPIYLHELLGTASLELPSPIQPVRTAEYEAKIQRLQALADEAEYQKMTKGLSVSSQHKESLGTELKQMDSHVTFLLNFVLTVLGAFAFGYKAVEYSLETPNISMQLTVGVTLATIVFFADVYFIIKKYV